MSIVIAMKNEVNNLENLFSSLETQNYPQDKYEVILSDDDSTDNSYQKAVELAQGKNNFRVIKADNKKFPGKKGALDFGISNAKYPFIVITDADCIPANNWLAGYSEKFAENYEFLLGLAPFIQTKGIINKISRFENLRSTILTFALTKLRLPYSAAARNMGFKKSSFEKLGGFSHTMQTISGDDDLLIREAVKQNMKIGIVSAANSFVLSNSKTTLSEYLNQKSRHTKTSLHYLPVHKLLLGFWHLSNILILFSLILLPVNFLFGLPFLLKICGDILVVFYSQRRLNYNFKLSGIPLLQLIYEFLLIVNFFNSFRKTIPWKD
jgi:cellulose synthase/poly-beta-1,6-N-acetylglucosamine synthase-like glycosyltransferase